VFITFEGTEGSGKTTQIPPLVDFLRSQGYAITHIREPGGTPIGDQVRDVLLSLRNMDMHPRTEILLFQASRAQLVEQVILPSLKKGEVVLCDRYADSTLAYQGYGYQQFAPEELKPLVEFATGGLKPHLTLFLDVDVEEGLKRRAKGGDWNRLDAYDRAFYERVREGYLLMARQEPQRWVSINAGGAWEQVQAEIRRVVLARLSASGASG
jgi:dTMP kinase